MRERLSSKGIATKMLSSVVMFAFIASSFFVTSCNRKDGDYPDIGSPTTLDAEQTIPTESAVSTTDPTGSGTDTGDFVTITVALPYSQSTVKRLSELYYLKSNGMLSDGDNGSNISLDHLDTVSTPWFINSIQTPMNGVDPSTLSEWRSGGYLPDIYLAEDIGSVIGSGDAAPLQQYLADNELVGSLSVFDGAIDALTSNGSIYGIPLYATAVILGINLDYVPDSGVPGYLYTVDELETYLQDVAAMGVQGEEETPASDLIPFAGAYTLIPYIAQAFSGVPTGFMAHDEYVRGNTIAASTAVRNVLGYIDRLYAEGLSSDSNANGDDPIAARNAGMWMLSSEEMENYDSYYPGRMYYLPLPSYDSETPSVPMLTIYPMCLSSESEHGAFAVEFASFIALDPDAQMLIRRLEPRHGYLPLIRNGALWLDMADSTDNGRLVSYFEPLMDSAVYCPGNYGSELYTAVNSYIFSYSANRSDEGETAGFSLQECYGGY